MKSVLQSGLGQSGSFPQESHPSVTSNVGETIHPQVDYFAQVMFKKVKE